MHLLFEKGRVPSYYRVLHSDENTETNTGVDDSAFRKTIINPVAIKAHSSFQKDAEASKRTRSSQEPAEPKRQALGGVSTNIRHKSCTQLYGSMISQ